jgi:hypothetical protein
MSLSWPSAERLGALGIGTGAGVGGSEEDLGFINTQLNSDNSHFVRVTEAPTMRFSGGSRAAFFDRT